MELVGLTTAAPINHRAVVVIVATNIFDIGVAGVISTALRDANFRRGARPANTQACTTSYVTFCACTRDTSYVVISPRRLR